MCAELLDGAAPIAGLGLTIQLTIDGLATMLRPTGEPLSQLEEKFVKYFAIVAIAGAGGLYETNLANAAMRLPDELESALLRQGNKGGSNSAVASLIDGSIDHRPSVMRIMFDHASLVSSSGMGLFILEFFLVISTLLIYGAGTVSILLLIVQPFVSFSGNWLGSVLNYIILIALTTMSFGVFLRFYDLAVSAVAKTNNDQPVGSRLTGLLREH